MRVPTYAWSDHDRPVTVRLSLRVVNRLALPELGEPSGGLLLGRTELHDGRHVIFIDQFEPVAPEQLASAIGRHRDAVGMYRTQARDGSLKIQLDEAVLFRHYFTRPDALFLLVHPGAGRAVFFSAEGDDFSAIHEFSFRPVDPAAVLVPHRWSFTRPQRWAIEALALIAGMVAGAALFQHFHPPPVWVPPSQYVADRSGPEVPPLVVTAHVEEPDPRPSPFLNLKTDPVPASKPRSAEPSAERVTPAAPDPPPVRETPRHLEAAAAPVAAPSAPTPPAPAPVRPATTPIRPLPTTDPTVSVEAEPVSGSRIGKVVGHIPLLRRLNHQQDTFVPPSPIHQVNPQLTARERGEVNDAVRVNVRVYVDEQGKVQYAELLSNASRHPDLASAAVYASRRWDFIPALQGSQHVAGEVILHFLFTPPGPPPAAVTDSRP